MDTDKVNDINRFVLDTGIEKKTDEVKTDEPNGCGC